MKEIKIINLLASTAFGVYLIQSHTFLAGKKIYIDLINTIQYVNSNFLIVHMIISTIGIYIVCSFIEILRQKILEDNIFKIKKFDKLFAKIDDFVNN